MQWLPDLATGRGRWRLPLADSSGAALAAWLVVGPDAATRDQITQALRHDPALALWAVCSASSSDGAGLRTASGLTTWLIEQGQTKLVYATDAEPVTPPADVVSRYAGLAATAAFVADRARKLVEADTQAADEAELLGLLHGAREWLRLAQTAGSADGSCLPLWLTKALGSSAARSAMAGLPKNPAGSKLGREARQRWLNEVPGLAGLLPALTRRLARLHDLESRFDETLEHEKLEAMAEFAAGAGHDINNPLAVISGRAQLFLRDEQNPERRRELALINSQAMRVYEMIADMMLFARPPKSRPEPCDLAALVDRVVESVRQKAAVGNTQVVRLGQRESLVIEVDPAQLTVALMAVCDNALEALAGGGTLSLELAEVEGQPTITVRDDGPGIVPEVRRHLFDPFYSGRSAGRGLGMGLSKCWRIVTNHGGRVDVASELGQGTAVTIALPATSTIPAP